MGDDRWCLVARRWMQAHEAGMAPLVFLRATNKDVLGLVPLETVSSTMVQSPPLVRRDQGWRSIGPHIGALASPPNPPSSRGDSVQCTGEIRANAMV
ncbi:MAG: DUF2237 domain-containing protein [Candidatus Devosia symbiotica]|nr:DUF2237 domain-containing protein [Candidatus Devosia symbiotica]